MLSFINIHFGWHMVPTYTRMDALCYLTNIYLYHAYKVRISGTQGVLEPLSIPFPGSGYPAITNRVTIDAHK